MTETATVRGVELAHQVDGEGATLVWAHGLSSSRAHEDDFGLLDWPALRSVCRAVRYDARGHGESEGSDDPDDYSWASLAADQLALCDALGIDRYVAGGASMGCGTALHAAVAAPERVSGLLLLIPPTAWEARQERVEIWDQVAQIVEARGHDTFLRAMRAGPVPEPLAGRSEWDDAYERAIRATEPARIARVFRGAGRADLPSREALRALRVPTLVLAWAGDPGHPERSALAVGELVPGAEVFVAHTWDELRSFTERAAAFLRAR
jgi:3-oxoadipate enol-lactonase